MKTRRVVAGVLIGLIACVSTVKRELVVPEKAATLSQKTPYLKAHLRTGYVYAFSTWSWEENKPGGTLVGTGELFDTRRSLVASGAFRLPVDSVGLFETNVQQVSTGGKSLIVMAGITTAVGIGCAMNPKACFGSCPTFYAPDSTGTMLLQAEGFSASIAPALEATDVDALYRARTNGRDLRIKLTNEALETHVIRYADVLAAPRPPNGRVFVTPGGLFRQAANLSAPSSCAAPEGNCLATVRNFDARERFTSSDSNDLGARETIDLVFDHPPAGELGLVIAARQSLMTTYLIYQGLAYLGDDAIHTLARLSPATPQVSRAEDMMGRVLGRIDVLVADSAGAWTLVGQTGETGPIATDTKIVSLPMTGDATLRVRLRITKGLWRIDWIALASMGDVVVPARIAPRSVRRGPVDDPRALAALTTHVEPLTTLPGDEFALDYRLPSDPAGLELFLESRGYYLEWMRSEWVAESNPMAAAQLLLDPRAMLRALAAPYKRQEATMDSLFWSSRYAKR